MVFQFCTTRARFRYGPISSGDSALLGEIIPLKCGQPTNKNGVLQKMKTNAEKAHAIFKQLEGKELGVGAWQEITQQRINQFAGATLDHQFIHTDPARAAEHSPYKVTIAHGFLTLSLIPHLNRSLPPLDPSTSAGLVMGINYGLDKVRFPAPVKVNSHVRSRVELISAELKSSNTIQLKHRVTVEIKGEEKPGCVAEILSRLVYE